MELITGINDHGRRLDRVLRKALPDCPLPLIHRLLRKGAILVNGKPANAQTRVVKGSKIHIPKLNAKKLVKKSIQKPDLSASAPLREEKKEDILAETPSRKEEEKPKKPAVPLSIRFYKPPEILWEGAGLIAFNKPAGLAVHGPVSLERMVQAALANKLPRSLSFKPGPLHRLDKPSSGIVVFSTSLEGAQAFTALMQEHKIKKTYLAIAEGELTEEKYSWTDYLKRDKEKKKTFVYAENSPEKNVKISITRVIRFATTFIHEKPVSLIAAEIETGRTHQIRAQSGHHGFPLAGDRKYGGKKDGIFKNGFFLHAWKMEFTLPDTTEPVHITAPLPDEFDKLVSGVFKYKL